MESETQSSSFIVSEGNNNINKVKYQKTTNFRANQKIGKTNEYKSDFIVPIYKVRTETESNVILYQEDTDVNQRNRHNYGKSNRYPKNYKNKNYIQKNDMTQTKESQEKSNIETLNNVTSKERINKDFNVQIGSQNKLENYESREKNNYIQSNKTNNIGRYESGRFHNNYKKNDRFYSNQNNDTFNYNEQVERNYDKNNRNKFNKIQKKDIYAEHTSKEFYPNKNAYNGSISNERWTRKETNKNISNEKSIDVSKLDQREYLIHELNLNRYECMICMGIVEKNNSTWCCDHCYHIFHLQCITKWAQSKDEKDTPEEEKAYWRCPACQHQNDNIKSSKLIYTCFCKKEVKPIFKVGTVAHSCGNVCGQSNKVNSKCPHLCGLECHPGPCPPCEASITRPCHCGRTRITARCITDESQFHCQSVCDKMLQCGLHKCVKECHLEDGHLCETILTQQCWCGRSYRDVLCGSPESISGDKYNCGKVCGSKKSCGNHNCESLCHEGDCDECEDLPKNVENCGCGKVSLNELLIVRTNCLDPIPSCGGTCDRFFEECPHKCEQVCHSGECKSCPGSKSSKCRCKSTVLTVECAASFDTAQCKQRCKSKLLCGRHRCEKQCCDLEVHLCALECGRMLSCKDHRCERECGHPGLCPSCPNVSFEELFCTCGVTYALPPIACNQRAPYCSRPCSRDNHGCEHQVRHNCHTESQCPPCTELVNKSCPGAHKEYANVPCFRPVITCGLICGKSLLPYCTHTCAKKCHSGPCLEEGEKCTLSCDTPRPDCNHPCGAPCHEGECDLTKAKCYKQLLLQCECTLKSSSIICHQLERIKSILLLETGKTSAEIVISSKDSKPYLSCDSECKRAARNSRLAESLNIEIPLSVIYTYYPNSVKDFGVKNKNFVILIQNKFIRIQNSFVNSTKVSVTETFCTEKYEESQFIQNYANCFKMPFVTSIDKKNRHVVTIEARRGVSQTPRPLLTEVLREKYPHLFPEREPEKVTVITTTPGSTLSFADRVKLKK